MLSGNNISNSNTHNVTNSPVVNLTVNALSGNADENAKTVRKEIDHSLGKTFQATNANLSEFQ